MRRAQRQLPIGRLSSWPSEPVVAKLDLVIVRLVIQRHLEHIPSTHPLRPKHPAFTW